MADAIVVEINRFSAVEIKVVANRYSFHERINTNAKVDAKPGRAMGNRMRIRDCKRLQPSTIADSSSSLDFAANTVLRFQIAKGRLSKVLATMSGICVSYKSNFTAMTKSAIASKMPGKVRTTIKKPIIK